MTPEATEEQLDNFSIQSFDLDEDAPSLFDWDETTDSTLGVDDQIKQFFEVNDKIPTKTNDKELNCNNDINLFKVTVSQRDNASNNKVRCKKTTSKTARRSEVSYYIIIHCQHMNQFNYLTPISPFIRQENQIQTLQTKGHVLQVQDLFHLYQNHQENQEVKEIED